PHAGVAALAGKPFPHPEVYTGTHPRVANVDIHRLIAYLRANPDEWQDPLALAPDADGLAALVERGMSLRLTGFRAARQRAIAADPAYALTGRVGEEPRPLLFFYDRDGCGTYWIARAEGRDTRLDDPLHLSQTLADLRRRQWLTHKLFREYVPGFERAHLVDMHPHIARALKIQKQSAGFTEYDMTWDEVVTGGSPHADAVARLLGHPGYGQAADGWQLPYRALIPKGLDGLLVIGKPAFRFIHYQGTVAAVGHAAGVAAAVAAQTGGPLRQVVVGIIQDELRRQGAAF
ncbi:MAG: FAD-dependent oxidoreductase, partial [Planctomycetes bacterium]|nr:FAD-dependent oxidoreductase [Planctomycetota bacterium]